MSNQTSEDELKKLLKRKELFDRLVFMFSWKGETRRAKANKTMKAIDQYTEDLIRTEKLKLLAEVRERVVGEGDLVDAEILKKLYDRAYSNGYNDKGYENSYNSRDYRSAEDIAPVIAKIRGGYDKRFAALNKLEAEL